MVLSWGVIIALVLAALGAFRAAQIDANHRAREGRAGRAFAEGEIDADDTESGCEC